MKERPILFSAPMVRAILDGRKTQTRRVVKPQPTSVRRQAVPIGAPSPSGLEDDHGRSLSCPYGAPGDRLWVRETWQIFDPHPDGDGDALGADRIKHGQRAPWTGVTNERAIEWIAAYRADGDVAHKAHGSALWRPSIHMPRWASRLTLAVTAVRVERLQAITAADAVDEGAAEILEPGHPLRAMCYERFGTWTGDPAKDVDGPFAGAVDAYATLWDDINGDRAPWASNPWVWVVEFTRVTEGATAP